MEILETQTSTHLAVDVQAAVFVGKLGKEVDNHVFYSTWPIVY